MTYLDAASTASLHPAARATLLAALDEGWADPSRLYAAARRARHLLDDAREAVAGAIGARADEVSFAGSGTAAAQLAILGTLAARRRVGRHYLTSAVEHSCVLHAAQAHERAGGTVATVGVDRLGRVDPDAYTAALRERPDTALASLMSANHEVGTVQPVAEVAAACRAAGVPLHVDAAQSVGQVPVDVTALGAQLLTASAHKWGGPAGVGVLVVRKGTRWRPPLPGDEREAGRVPGFENVPAILAAAAALQARLGELAAAAARRSALVDRIRADAARIPDVDVVGDPVHRLPHIVTLSCRSVDGEALLTELDRAGFAVSSAASCTSSTLPPHHVLEAMGLRSGGHVRVSLDADSTTADVERFLTVLPGIVAGLRECATTGVS